MRVYDGDFPDFLFDFLAVLRHPFWELLVPTGHFIVIWQSCARSLDRQIAMRRSGGDLAVDRSGR